MTPDSLAVAAMIILLFPMGYFTLASPAFLLVKLDVRPVALLLRGMFNAHFLVMGAAGIIGTVAFLLAGQLVFATVVGLLAALAIGGRRRFMARMDNQLSAGESWQYTGSYTVTQSDIDTLGNGSGLIQNTVTADSAQTTPVSASASVVVESGAGVAEGARTGFASVVTGLLFLAAILLAPLTAVVPAEATAASAGCVFEQANPRG